MAPTNGQKAVTIDHKHLPAGSLDELLDLQIAINGPMINKQADIQQVNDLQLVSKRPTDNGLVIVDQHPVNDKRGTGEY